MNETLHTNIVDLIPAYALGALDSGEREMVARHLETCSLCQAELEAYQAVVDVLPLAVPGLRPDAAVKQRLVAQVHSPGLAAETAAVSPRRSFAAALQRLLFTRRWQPVLVLLVVALLVGNLFLWQRLNELDAPAENQIILTGTEDLPEAHGMIVISQDGRHATLIVENLPPLHPEQQYQLWLIQDGQRANGGVFSVNAAGYSSLEIAPPEPLYHYSAFGITIEPAGGSPGPTGARVLGYNL